MSIKTPSPKAAWFQGVVHDQREGMSVGKLGCLSELACLLACSLTEDPFPWKIYRKADTYTGIESYPQGEASRGSEHLLAATTPFP
jgi:hypothetical protein